MVNGLTVGPVRAWSAQVDLVPDLPETRRCPLRPEVLRPGRRLLGAAGPVVGRQQRLSTGGFEQGEEFGAEAGTSGLTWVIDPIDGTSNFVRGISELMVRIPG